MDNVATIYISRALYNFDNEELAQLAQKSGINNAKSNITGFLIYKSGYFLQYIEGSAHAISYLINKVVLDERHQIVYKLSKPVVSERKFDQWGMKLLNNSFIDALSVENFILEQVKYNHLTNTKNQETASLVWAAVDNIAKQYQSAIEINEQ